MDVLNWQEIAVRLLFASILGSATAASRRWHQTQKSIQSNTQMALGAAIFSILISLTSEIKFSFELILGISIVCGGASLQKQSYLQNMNVNVLMSLWCAGALGSMAGFGLFMPAYIGVVLVIINNLLFSISEKSFIPQIKKKFNDDDEPQLVANISPQSNSTISQEISFRCQVNCLAVDEAEVLTLLVQLGKEKKLIPTKVDIRNIVDDSNFSQVAIQVDFISHDNNSFWQIQQILISLKSKINVISASFIHPSSEITSERNESMLISEAVSRSSSY